MAEAKFPPHVAKLFEARPPLKYIKPLDFSPEKRCTSGISPLSSVIHHLASYSAPKLSSEYLELNKQSKTDPQVSNLKQKQAEWDPNGDAHIQGDPYKTIFVGRLDYSVTEVDLQKEFAKFGEVSKVRVVKDPEGKSRGYGFILFEDQNAARTAYKEAECVFNGRRVVVDIERGRTIKYFKPMRLGGGLGGRGDGKQEKLSKIIKTERQPRQFAPPRRMQGRDGFKREREFHRDSSRHSQRDSYRDSHRDSYRDAPRDQDHREPHDTQRDHYQREGRMSYRGRSARSEAPRDPPSYRSRNDRQRDRDLKPY